MYLCIAIHFWVGNFSACNVSSNKDRRVFEFIFHYCDLLLLLPFAFGESECLCMLDDL
jgi:hypothetical protein